MENGQMHVITETEIDQGRKSVILNLWNTEYPAIIRLPSLKELDEYFAGLSPLYHLFLVNEQEEIKGWLFLFERAGETWFAMILDRAVQGAGYGTKLLEQASALSPVLNGWAIDGPGYVKTDGSAYASPLDFYCKRGFIILDEKLQQPFSAVKVRKENAL